MAPEVLPEEKVVKTIVVIYAMAAEAAPLVAHLNLEKSEKKRFPNGAPFIVYSGSHDGITVDVVIPGKDEVHGVDNVGTVPSAVLTYAAIDAFKPDVIINAGTAGGFKAKGAAIGDVYIATHVANHDRRILLPGFEKYGIGEVAALSSQGLIDACGLKEGRVTTGNSFDMSAEDKEYIEASGAVVKDMECAGVAWVAKTFGIPIIAIKSITDIVDGGRPTQEEFLENLHAAATSLQKTVPAVVSYIGGKKISQL